MTKNTNNSSQNKNDFEKVYSLTEKVLNSSFLIKLAAKSPLMTNIIIGIILPFTGVNIYQTIQEKSEIESYQLTNCKIAQNNVLIGTNNFVVKESVISSGDNNSFTCVYHLANNQPDIKVNMVTIPSESTSTINENSFCQKSEKLARKRIGQRTNLELNSEKPDDNENYIFRCIYKDKNSDNTVKLLINLHPHFSNHFAERHNERLIVIEEVNEQICKNKNFYEKELEKDIEGNLDNYLINAKGIKLLENQNIYPVFRWNCEYEYKKRGRQYENTRFQKSHIGLNLDKDYCEKNFASEGLTKSTYHDYKNPYSWFCTNSRPNSAE